MKKILCLFLCVCMLLALSSPALAADLEEMMTTKIENENVLEGASPASARMKEIYLDEEGIHLNGYFDVHLYARADRVSGRIGYQYKTTLGVNLYILSGSAITGWIADIYDKTTSSPDTYGHEHLWDSGNYFAISVVAKYLVRGSNIYSLSTSDLQ